MKAGNDRTLQWVTLINQRRRFSVNDAPKSGAIGAMPTRSDPSAQRSEAPTRVRAGREFQ